MRERESGGGAARTRQREKETHQAEAHTNDPAHFGVGGDLGGHHFLVRPHDDALPVDERPHLVPLVAGAERLRLFELGHAPLHTQADLVAFPHLEHAGDPHVGRHREGRGGVVLGGGLG